jgi:type VI secretion system protein ImpA
MLLDLETLLAPLSGDNPAGEDISFADDYDQIKEARRADDPNEPRGEWGEEPKVAEWRKARDLATEVLTEKSKDLQVACWLCEAVTELHGFAGLHDGLELMRGLIENFWDTLYPSLEDGDLEPRSGKLTWLATNLPPVIRRIALTSPETGGYGWQRWDESRQLENLGRQNPEAMEQAIADGKIAAATFDKAVRDTSGDFYHALYDAVGLCRSDIGDLEQAVDGRFGRDAPSLIEIRKAIQDCYQLVERLAREKGVLAATATAAAAAAGEETTAGVAVAATTTTGVILPGVASLPAAALVLPATALQTRQEALRRLEEIALFFRQTEPHNPVSYLIERAVKWGNMTLLEWLQEIKNEGESLEGLLKTLGIKESTAEG